MTKILAPLAAVLLCRLSAAAAQDATGGPLVLTDTAVVYGDAAAAFEVPSGATGGATGFLGRLTAGAVHVATVGAASFAAGPLLVRLDDALARAAIGPDGVFLCADEGTVTIGDGIAIDPGRCILHGGDGAIVDVAPDAIPAFVSRPPADGGLALPDDPHAEVERLAAAWAAGGDEEGESGDAQTGGAAACLDTGGTGTEASSPEATETPETEIDRSQHRVDAVVTLEGY